VIELKKYVSVIFTAAFLLSAFSYINTSYVSATQVVHVPSDYATIQEAIDSSLPGTTIVVAKGVYFEHPNIPKYLTLVGEDRDTTVIDGSDSSTVLSVTADNVAIRNLTITKNTPRTFDTGIGIDRANGISIDNVKISGIYTGLAFYSSVNNVVSNNIIANNTGGIVLLYSNNNLFSDNIFTINAQGIGLAYSTFNTFVGNTLSGDIVGVFLASSSSRNTFYHNNFEDPVQVSSGSYNTWSRGNEGNYWTTYNFTGQDVNGDGIGEHPFRIDDFNVDNYPLMGYCEEFSINFANMNYIIVIVSNSTVSDLQFEIGKETGNKIIRFITSGKNAVKSFCRMMIPRSLMDPPFTVEGSSEPLTLSLLSVSNETNSYLYFIYSVDDITVSVISSKELQLYAQLLDQYIKLQASFSDLNYTYQGTIVNYTIQYEALLENFTQLQSDFLSMRTSLNQSLLNQSDNAQNFRNLTYVFATLTAAFLVTTVYLSNRLYTTKKQKTYQDEK
jgi:parallel beta-helix repeat protein